MLKKLLPRQENFFKLFQQAAFHLVGASEEFSNLIADLQNANRYVTRIADHETMADSCARDAYDLLHKTFITPFDRHDIHQLTRKLDDVLDTINRTAQRIALYQVTQLSPGIEEIAKLVLLAATSIQTALKELENLKNANDIIQLCRAVNHASSQAEQIMLEEVGRLFLEETDIKQLFKNKEIYEYATSIMRKCHDLADIVKGIVLEYS